MGNGNKHLTLPIGLESYFHDELLKKLQKCFHLSVYYDGAMNGIVQKTQRDISVRYILIILDIVSLFSRKRQQYQLSLREFEDYFVT